MDTEREQRSGLLALPHLDWRAYLVSGLVAGLLALLAGILLSSIVLGEPRFILRLAASLVLGPEVIPTVEGNTAPVLIVGLLLHFALTFAYALVVVWVIHRWGLVVGLIGGALTGLALYIIDIYALSYFFPWIYPLRNWLLLWTHLILGGLVGVIYELLDNYDLPFPVSGA